MKINKKTKEAVSRIFLWISIISVISAAVGAVGMDIWLASTQWLLVAAVSTLFAIYLKLT